MEQKPCRPTNLAAPGISVQRATRQLKTTLVVNRLHDILIRMQDASTFRFNLLEPEALNDEQDTYVDHVVSYR